MKTFIFVLLATATALAGDWPRFRGPNGTGISDAMTIPATWTTNDYRWVVTLPGNGHSSPVIVGNRLFLTCADDATAKRIVLCLDATTGKILWQREFASKLFRKNKDNSNATSTPAADERGVIVAWNTDDEVILLALDNNGREMWKRDFGPFVGAHGTGNSPIIAGGFAILDNSQEDPAAFDKPEPSRPAGKSFIVAVDRASGTTRWQLDRKTCAKAVYGTPCLRGGNELIVCSTAHGVSGIDLATGKLNWELPGVFNQRVVSSTVLAGDVVINGCGGGGVGAYYPAVKAGAKAEQIFKIEKPVPYVPTALVKDGRLFLWGDTGTIICANAATGKEIWRDRVQGAFYSSPLWAGGRLYNIAKNGDVFVLSAGDKFELLARIPLGEKSHASPAAANGTLYLRTYTKLFALGGK
jgi:outer membrane protein assembly factor BamB